MNRRKAVLVWFATLPLAVAAQDKIETDRPTEAQAAQGVEKRTFQAEIGLRKGQKNKDDDYYYNPDVLLRYGLTNWLELRVNTVFESQKYRSENAFNYGLAPVEAGVKVRVFQAKDTSFTATLYGHLGYPKLASADHQQDQTFYRTRLLLENKISEFIKLNTNIGRDWDNDEQEQNWMYSVSPQFELTDKWQVFLEEYATFKEGSRTKHYVDAGVGYFINDKVQLDVDAGKGISSRSDDYFITAGISFKLLRQASGMVMKHLL